MADYIIPLSALVVSVASLLFVSKVSFNSANVSEVQLLRTEVKELRSLYEECMRNEARLQRENNRLMRSVLGLPPEEPKI